MVAQTAMPLLPFIVKNTFVDVAVNPGETSRRRSVSEPPTPTCRDSELPRKEDLIVSDTSTNVSAEDMYSNDIEADETDGSSTCPECSPSPTFCVAPVTPLNRKAMPWSPAEILPDPLPYKFGKEAAHVMTVTKEALEQSGLVYHVEIQNDGAGWFINIQVKNSEYTQRILNIAKTKLLQAAEASTCTYVLGYKNRPWALQPFGFTAALGAMRDESQACWDAYGKGRCREPMTCRFAHPCCVMHASVAVWA